MSVLEVKFDPTIWKFTADGTGSFSVFMDKDNASCWVFEAFGGGFARVKLSDGTFLVQDTLFGEDDTGNTSGGPFWQCNWYPNNFQSWLAQDGAGNYYFTAQGLKSSGFGSSTYLFKFQVGAGSAGNLLNGYCTDAVTNIDIKATATTAGYSDFDALDSCLWTIGGVTYFAILCYGATDQAGFLVIDTATMTLVKNVQPVITGDVRGYNIFADNHGVVWAVISDFNGNVTMVSYNVGTDTIATQAIPQTVHTLPTNTDTNFANGGYLPATGNLLLADTGYLSFSPPMAGTANIAIISMSSWTLLDFVGDVGTLFHNSLELTVFAYTSSAAAMQSLDALAGGATPITPTHPTAFALEGAVTPVGGTQVGGILNLIDQSTMNVLATLNVTNAINTGGVADPIDLENVSAGSGGTGTPASQYQPLSSLAWNPNVNKGAACYPLLTVGNQGSALYIFDTPPLPAPKGPSNAIFCAGMGVYKRV